MNQPTISIIIPLYNRLKAFEKCLASIQNQTYKNFEVIVINDGSTECSEEEVEKTIQQFNNVTISIYHQQNQGAPVARNNGFAQSSGKYILFCDADIVMQPSMLANMHTTLEQHPEVSYVYSSFKFGWKTFRLWEFDPEKLKKMPYIHTTSLIRREHVVPFDPALKKFQDWDLWLTMLEQGHVGLWIPEILFTIQSGGVMSSWMPSFLTKISWFGRNKRYQKAEQIIRKKHNL